MTQILEEILQFVEDNMSNGIYVAVKYTDESVDILSKFIEDNHIANPVNVLDIHTTIIYSRQYDEIETMGYKFNIPVEIFKFEVWKTQGGKSALVAKLFAPELIKRHHYLMSNHDLTYDFPEYKPHITLSYDIGDDFDINLLDASSINKLYTSHEYVEDLELDWTSKA